MRQGDSLIATSTADIVLPMVGCDIPDISLISCWKVPAAKNPNVDSVRVLFLNKVPNCAIIPVGDALGDESNYIIAT